MKALTHKQTLKKRKEASPNSSISMNFSVVSSVGFQNSTHQNSNKDTFLSSGNQKELSQSGSNRSIANQGVMKKQNGKKVLKNKSSIMNDKQQS